MDTKKHLTRNDEFSVEQTLSLITRIAKSCDEPYNFIYEVLDRTSELTEDFGWLDEEYVGI